MTMQRKEDLDPDIAVLDSRATDFKARFEVVSARGSENLKAIETRVVSIINAVKTQGDAALLRLTATLDGYAPDPENFVIRTDAIRRAAETVTGDEREALEAACLRIKAYHERQRPEAANFTDPQGVQLGWLYRPLDSVGIYVPGGTAAYPSSLLMAAIPAQVAGVKTLALAMPTPDGRLPPLVAAAAQCVGIETIYPVGGAQAIAALAFGTAQVPRVNKIVGPGNAYVAAAKRALYGQVGIDVLAGPSEVAIFADASARAPQVAADLIAQAEHDGDARAHLFSTSQSLLDSVKEWLARIAAPLPRAHLIAQALSRNGALIRVRSPSEAFALIAEIAPEHLQIMTDNPEAHLDQVRHAGAVFLGHDCPTALGDYVAGPSHVLPTAGWARFASGLGVDDFLKRTSVVGCKRGGIERIGPYAARLAKAEGLDAHALSITLRLEK